MFKKIATVVYVVIQLLFFAAGLAVLKYQTDLQASLTAERLATIIVVFYALGVSSRRIFDAVIPYVPLHEKTGITRA